MNEFEEYKNKVTLVVMNSGEKKKGQVINISNGFITLRYFSKNIESINLLNVSKFFIVKDQIDKIEKESGDNQI